MHPSKLLPLALLATATALAATDAAWPMFRGPNASGIAAHAKPPVKLSPTENVRWKVAVPAGASSPCVWGDRLFLTAFDDGKLVTQAYDRHSGKLLWTRLAPIKELEEFHQTEGSPASSMPATDGETVLVYFGSGALLAYDFVGRERWRVALPKATTSGNFGSGTSPLLADGVAVLARDLATGSSIAGYDLATGRKLWETPRADSPTSYGSPILWQNQGVTEIVMAGSLTMKGYDPKTGAERWVVRNLPSFTCTTPVVGDGQLFFAGWSPGKADSPWPSWESTVEKQDKNSDDVISLAEFAAGPVWFKAQDIDGDGQLTRKDWETIGGLMKRGENVLLALKPGGSGDITGTHVAWRATKGLPYVPSPVHHDGRVYLVKDGGMASCYEAATGKAIYQQERLGAVGNYYASPVVADGRLYVASLDGKLTVFKAGGDQPEVLSQADFGERIWASVAPVGDTLYLRTAGHLYAFAENAR